MSVRIEHPSSFCAGSSLKCNVFYILSGFS
jgi:hypothetical protein